MANPVTAGREQVLAFRLDSHNLARRLPAGSLLQAAAACGVQDSPPGSAALALHARVADLAPVDLERAKVDKTLLLAWSLRAAPYLFPTADAAVFTQGLLPQDEESLRHFIRGCSPALDRVGLTAVEVLERTEAALRNLLDGQTLTKDQLGLELARRLAQQLPPQQLAAWLAPSWYAPGQFLGESVVRFVLYLIALQGQLCFTPRRGRQATLARTDQWLGAPLPELDREQAQAELVRRYLHCYGPSTAEQMAHWAGIAPAQAAGMWKLVAPDLIEVAVDGRSGWLLGQDRDAFLSPAVAEGIRLLPPHDPYLSLSDRQMLVADRALQRHIWRSSGNPGVVLVEGRLMATWRHRKTARRLHVAIEWVAPASPSRRSQLEAEAESLAPYCGCKSVAIKFP